MVWRKYGRDGARSDVVAAAGEFVGTFLFLFLGLAGIQAARDASSNFGADFLLMAATSMAMALIFTLWIFDRITTAAFNPNVALSLLVLGYISPLRFVLYFIAQILGAIAASAVLAGLLPGPLQVNTVRAADTSIARACFIEMFLTAALCLTILKTIGSNNDNHSDYAHHQHQLGPHGTTAGAAAPLEGNRASYAGAPSLERNRLSRVAPLAIGFALFSTQLAGLRYTGAAVSTARAFGPAVITGDFIGSHWVYWIGPTLGALLAAGVHYGLLKARYWDHNAGLDSDNHHHHGEKRAIANNAPLTTGPRTDHSVDGRTVV